MGQPQVSWAGPAFCMRLLPCRARFACSACVSSGGHTAPFILPTPFCKAQQRTGAEHFTCGMARQPHYAFNAPPPGTFRGVVAQPSCGSRKVQLDDGLILYRDEAGSGLQYEAKYGNCRLLGAWVGGDWGGIP